MGNKVNRFKTEISEPQMAQAILEGWRDMFGTTPSKQQVALVLAQNALETGHRKSMWNFNVGNITTDGKGQYDYFNDLRTNEQTSPGVWKSMNLKYRAYPSLKDGVKDYLKLLSGKHYSNAWEHIINPDPVAFSKALKHSGYYTADEAPYTKNLAGLYSQFSKSKGYDEAIAGRVKLPEGTPMTADKDDILQKYLARIKGKENDVYTQLDNKPLPVATAPQAPATSITTDLTTMLNSFVQQIAASERSNKKLYKQFLPTNHLVIKIASKNFTDAIEFSRVLCTALDEELLARAFTHTDGHDVEVGCAISGPAEECFEAVKQLTNSMKEAFCSATSKIGGIEIKSDFITNKKSSYQQISFKTASIHYRKFLLKFI